MSEAVIVEAVRTPVGRRNGSLSAMRPDALGALVLNELVRRSGVAPHQVEDLLLGCVTQVGEQGFNVARQVALLADLPLDLPAATINRLCGSGQQALNFAAMAVASGFQSCVMAGGVEVMSRVPLGGDAQVWGDPFGPSLHARYRVVNQGISAELIAEKWDLSREELDDFSCQSHLKAAKAIKEGYFDREITPVKLPDGHVLAVDEGVRLEPDRAKMGTLQPAFQEGGKVTAANSSQISDGAAALLVMSREKAEALGFRPRARVVGMSLAGVDPTLMLTGPIPASEKVLAQTGLSWAHMDLVEVNEAFASVALAFIQETGVDPDRVNVNGGAIALGHPLGASGARIATSLLHELERRDARYGLMTMCIGMGQGIATVIERL